MTATIFTTRDAEISFSTHKPTHICNGSKKKGCSGCKYDDPSDEESLNGTSITRRCDLYGFVVKLEPIATDHLGE